MNDLIVFNYKEYILFVIFIIINNNECSRCGTRKLGKDGEFENLALNKTVYLYNEDHHRITTLTDGDTHTCVNITAKRGLIFTIDMGNSVELKLIRLSNHPPIYDTNTAISVYTWNRGGIINKTFCTSMGPPFIGSIEGECRRPSYGRFIEFQTKFKSNTNLYLCEALIAGDINRCPLNYYGKDCDQKCNCPRCDQEGKCLTSTTPKTTTKPHIHDPPNTGGGIICTKHYCYQSKAHPSGRTTDVRYWGPLAFSMIVAVTCIFIYKGIKYRKRRDAPEASHRCPAYDNVVFTITDNNNNNPDNVYSVDDPPPYEVVMMSSCEDPSGGETSSALPTYEAAIASNDAKGLSKNRSSDNKRITETEQRITS